MARFPDEISRMYCLGSHQFMKELKLRTWVAWQKYTVSPFGDCARLTAMMVSCLIALGPARDGLDGLLQTAQRDHAAGIRALSQASFQKIRHARLRSRRAGSRHTVHFPGVPCPSDGECSRAR